MNRKKQTVLLQLALNRRLYRQGAVSEEVFSMAETALLRRLTQAETGDTINTESHFKKER